ncbi:uncharacterized protein LOC115223810 [Octopus sinensis]|uniref:Uncharacterized protein LOC115223810 n=1 Tax=Octopus sinensis TaxID=2607531 RepID=A0A6P7TG45_9MOLL|nr:uncharacterized protein LOC115223810 [Octopus sinensis]
MFVPYQLHNSHDSHLGIQQMLSKISLEFWWSNMVQGVTTFISSCAASQQNQSTKDYSIAMWNKDSPWECFHMDWAFMNCIGNLLTVVSSYSNYIDAIRCISSKKKNVPKCLMRLFGLSGLSKVTVSDSASEFTVLKGWLSTPTDHPQSNGRPEQAVHTIKHALFAWNPLADDWYPYLLNHQSSRGRKAASPGERLFGRPLHTSCNP